MNFILELSSAKWSQRLTSLFLFGSASFKLFIYISTIYSGFYSFFDTLCEISIHKSFIIWCSPKKKHSVECACSEFGQANVGKSPLKKYQKGKKLEFQRNQSCCFINDVKLSWWFFALLMLVCWDHELFFERWL